MQVRQYHEHPIFHWNWDCLIELPLTQLGICYLHYLLVCRLPSSKLSLNLGMTLLIILVSILPQFPDLRFSVSGQYMTLCLKLLDINLLPKSLTSGWTLREYCEFWWLGNTRLFKVAERKMLLLRLEKDPKDKNARELLERDVDLNVQPPSYWVNLALQLSVQAIALILLPVYFMSSKYDWNPAPYHLFTNYFDIDLAIHYYLSGLLLYSGIGIGFVVAGHVASYILDIPYRRPFTDPFISTSLTMFWSRWNLPVQGALKRIAFDPTISFFQGSFEDGEEVNLKPKKVDHTSRLPNQRPRKIKPLAKATAVHSTFILSACLHEWSILALASYIPFEQFLFFILHATLVLLETWAVELVHKKTGYHILKDTHPLILNLWLHVVILTTSPLILNSYIRSHAFADVMTPYLGLLIPFYWT